MRPLILIALALVLLAGGCAQQPKQMDLCEYYLWLTSKAREVAVPLRNGDVYTAAEIARQIEEQPAPEQAQRYKEIIIQLFALDSSAVVSMTAEASATDNRVRTIDEISASIEQLRKDLDEMTELYDQLDAETMTLGALCPEEARQLEALRNSTPTP